MINNEIKVIAFYLPQFHVIPENSDWWGENFTEWVNVKNAHPLYEGHVQPKKPLNGNYYDLNDDQIKVWQSKIAIENGVFGFCYYHYWFNGKMLLEKPMEQMLNNHDITIPFCISWANVSWTKEWVGDSKTVLIPQTYGGRKDWDLHYDYLLKFFRDERYIYKNGKPLFIIYNPLDMPDCADMMNYWNQRAIDDGLGGICFAYQTMGLDLTKNTSLKECFDYNIEFQPSYGLYEYDKHRHAFLRRLKRAIVRVIGPFSERVLHINLSQAINPQSKVRIIDYDKVWQTILSTSPISKNSIPGAFAKWDNTPRKGNRGIVYANSSPEKFEKYLRQQIDRTKNVYKQDMLFLYAWNEWAEGGFIEPDEENGYEYLEAINNAVNN